MRKFVWKITRVTNKTSQICQYRVCPPVASMQATQRRRILLMSLAICSWGILLHSSCKAAPKAWSVLGRGTLCRARWPRMSQTCSIGDVRGSSRPIEMIHIVLLQKLLYYPRPMRSCVVILQHYVVP